LFGDVRIRAEREHLGGSIYNISVRLGVLAALLAVGGIASVVRADTGTLEGTGFIGIDDFGDKIGLGNSLAPEQRPQTSPMFGGRLTYILFGTPSVEVGAEAELTFTPSWTGYGFDGPRPSYFAPVFGYRGSVLLRFPSLVRHALPHLLAGGGGETVVSGSPFMTNGTDPVLYYGVGVTFDVAPGWQMRFDGRQGFMPASDGTTTATYELLVGVGTRFGASRATPIPKERVDVATKPKPPEDPDTDGDGIPDRLDQCPLEPETKNGIDDDDGCPEPDPDGDGIVGSADKCPDQAEDFDHFQDEDGCPDPDNDNDGIVDAKDACPNQPETRNGFEDDDGCPDTIPDAVVAAFASATAARFETGKVRLTDAAKLALDKSLAVLRKQPTIHVVITGHPTGKNDDSAQAELAKKRAEVVKWYLVEQGIPADQIDTAVGARSEPKGPSIELAVAPK
jgi:OmpA-OmpF porin, OOP family